MMAGSGRGGGGFASQAERLGREKREGIAKALAAGETTTSTPPNLPISAFINPSAESQTLTGLGGMMGNFANLAMLSQLFGKS
jgi:hypothetical protein